MKIKMPNEDGSGWWMLETNHILKMNRWRHADGTAHYAVWFAGCMDWTDFDLSAKDAEQFEKLIVESLQIRDLSQC
jgi:hypothetical protein